MRHFSFLLIFASVLFGSTSALAQFGCTDPLANNYDPTATFDDGSCTYDGILGCTDPGADNYNPEATIDDGSCYIGGIWGCTDFNAANYDPSATYDDGSCYYNYYGCTDPGAVNFDPNANADDGSCYYYNYGCTNPLADNYDPFADVDDGSCYFSGTFGCTDPLAVNYDPWANYEDGSCYYYYYGCMDASANNYDPTANFDDGSCTYDYYDCNNDFNGTAVIDDCGDCTGGNTGLEACVISDIASSEIETVNLALFPNPSNGQFSLTLPDHFTGAISLQLVDVAGRMVMDQAYSATKGAALQLETKVEDGLYLLTVVTASGKKGVSTLVVRGSAE